MVKRNVSRVEPLSPGLKQAFAQLIAARTGIKIRENDQETFERLVAGRRQAVGLPFSENYYELLEADSESSREEWKDFIAEITNSESFFFRDKGQFKLLRNDILPDLIQQNQRGKTLRICSAGCSTGEEPYSIAMLLSDILPDIQQWNITVIGIDINSAAVEKAQAGIYRPWSFRGVPPEIKQQFFDEKNGLLHIAPDIKNMVKFQTVNLLTDDFDALPFPVAHMDLVLCRNVFIYFSDVAIKQVLSKFYDALDRCGYLIVGHAELHSQNLSQFQVKMFDDSIAYRPIPERSMRSPQASPAGRIPYRRAASKEKDARPLEQQFEGSNTKMQQSALGLLKQLPADMRIPRLGNLTAAELIAQIEQNSKIAE